MKALKLIALTIVFFPLLLPLATLGIALRALAALLNTVDEALLEPLHYAIATPCRNAHLEFKKSKR